MFTIPSDDRLKIVHSERSFTKRNCGGSERRSEIARRRDAYEAQFRTIIADGVVAGTFGPLDPAVSAAFILTALNGIVAWYRPEGRIKPADLADAYADLALRAVAGVPR